MTDSLDDQSSVIPTGPTTLARAEIPLLPFTWVGKRFAAVRASKDGQNVVTPLLPWRVLWLESANFLLSLGMIALLLAMIFKYLPDAAVAWSEAWMGAAVASLLLTTGKALIGLYLAKSTLMSAYGAASSLVIILNWVYYSAQITLFGAEVAHVYSRQHGSRAEGNRAHLQHI
jgi:uncharacterized BrkB/YihY/UPF0761 family membrane protein